jgi:hypothetical protein
MVQCRYRPRLALEASAELFLANLNGDLPVEPDIQNVRKISGGFARWGAQEAA